MSNEETQETTVEKRRIEVEIELPLILRICLAVFVGSALSIAYSLAMM
jgi:hypothetical protein